MKMWRAFHITGNAFNRLTVLPLFFVRFDGGAAASISQISSHARTHTSTWPALIVFAKEVGGCYTHVKQRRSRMQIPFMEGYRFPLLSLWLWMMDAANKAPTRNHNRTRDYISIDGQTSRQTKGFIMKSKLSLSHTHTWQTEHTDKGTEQKSKN